MAIQKRKTEQQARALADCLKGAVKRPDLRGLAEWPLLLNVMALLHTSYGQLPEDRVELYQWAADLMLKRWKGELDSDAGFISTLNMPHIRKSALEAGIFKIA